jgi:hypothetical protein
MNSILEINYWVWVASVALLLHFRSLTLSSSLTTAHIRKVNSTTWSSKGRKRHTHAWSAKAHSSTSHHIKQISFWASTAAPSSSSPWPSISKKRLELRWQPTLTSSHLFEHLCENILGIETLKWILALTLLSSHEIFFISIPIVRSSFIIVAQA